MKPIYLLLLAIIFVFSCANDSKNEVITQSDDPRLQLKLVPVPERIGKSVKLDKESFKRMSKSELRIARNTIFALHGRAFKSKDLQAYFKSKSWYRVDPSYTDDRLTKEDRDLIALILYYEKK